VKLTKQLAAGLTTAILITGLIILAAIQSRNRSAADTAEQCLEQMFQAMKAGDVAGYLACFSGELRERLVSTAQDQTREKFAQYLKDLARPIKGRAVMQDKIESSGPDTIRLVVDRVYDGRPWEYQAYRLRREAGSWKIYEIEPPVLHDPPIPYGTPAYAGAEKSDEAEQSKPSPP